MIQAILLSPRLVKIDGKMPTKCSRVNMFQQKSSARFAVLFICLFQVIAVMGFLVRGGRLSIVPIYDDVVYLIDGLRRLAVLDRAGIGGFLLDFYSHPAHAPFTAMAGAFGFLMSGGAVWGPYLLNAAWVFIVAGLALSALRHLNPWSRAGIVIAILAAPMFGSVLAEFRPDPVWGLLIGFSLALMASINLAHAPPYRLFMLGLLLGAAVLAKPTGSPASAVVLGIGLMVQAGLTRVALSNCSWRVLARGVGTVILGASLLVIPYILTNGRGILTYILEVTRADNSVWKTNAPMLGHLTYYLNRGAGTLMLGWVWFVAVPTLILCVGILVRAREKIALCGFAGLLSSVLVAYIIVSVSEVKSLMIGSLLYGSIIGAVTWFLGQIVRHFPIRHSVVFILGIAVFVTQWVPRAGMIQRSDPAMVVTDEANNAAFPAVLRALRQSGDAKTVLITVPGPVYAGTLEFLALQQGVSANFKAGYTWNTWEMFMREIGGSDIVVLSESGMRGQALGFNFPSVQFQQRLLSTLRADVAFTGKPVFTDDQGRSVWVFVRK
jgi:hypothetical protein